MTDNQSARPAPVLPPLVPDNPEQMLTRKATAAALTAKGLHTSESALKVYASYGGGPPYSIFQKRVLYKWGTALQWALSRVSPARATATEHRAAGREAKQPIAGRKPQPKHKHRKPAAERRPSRRATT